MVDSADARALVERSGREVHYRLVDGWTICSPRPDRVLEHSGDRVMAYPRYGARAVRREAA
jgi:hypothetical protein